MNQKLVKSMRRTIKAIFTDAPPLSYTDKVTKKVEHAYDALGFPIFRDDGTPQLQEVIKVTKKMALNCHRKLLKDTKKQVKNDSRV